MPSSPTAAATIRRESRLEMFSDLSQPGTFAASADQSCERRASAAGADGRGRGCGLLSGHALTSRRTMAPTAGASWASARARDHDRVRRAAVPLPAPCATASGRCRSHLRFSSAGLPPYAPLGDEEPAGADPDPLPQRHLHRRLRGALLRSLERTPVGHRHRSTGSLKDVWPYEHMRLEQVPILSARTLRSQLLGSKRHPMP